jgi:hypothetical protein
MADGQNHELVVNSFAIRSILAATEAYETHICEALGDVKFFKGSLNTGDDCCERFEMAIEISTTVSFPSKPYLSLLTI